MKLTDTLYNLVTKSSGFVLQSEWLKRRMLAPEIYHSDRIPAAIKSFAAQFPDGGELGATATDTGSTNQESGLPETGVETRAEASAEADPTASQSLQSDSDLSSGQPLSINDEEPVFVFSAGWGSGSTLIQRLLISSGEVLVWGEPVDEAGPILRLAQTISAVREDWPPKEHFRPGFEASELQGEWIANFAPEMFRYKEAHRQFYLSWLAADARRSGIKRWGLKEVRLTIDHARYLKWLFPKARFVFIYRDLYGSYLSIRRRPWLSVWPDHSATQIVAFAHHWKHLLNGFLKHHEEVDGVMVRYEDLSSGQCDLDALASALNIGSIDHSLLEKKVGGRSARRRPLILPEKLVLDSIAGDLREELGYK